MSWSDTMTVQVGYEIADEPTDMHLRSLRWGAEALTDDKGSVAVEQREKGDRHVVIVRFTMREMAQYKVVGDIHHQFEISFASDHLYEDSWIAFPKE